MSDNESSALETKGRIQYLDLLKVLAIMAVVFLHSSAATLRAADGSSVWHFANVVTSLTAARLPLFFMVSGALIISSAKTLSISYTLKQRVLRLFVPLLAWSFIYVAYGLAVSWRVEGAADWAEAVDKLMHLPGTRVTVSLWFMYALIGVYILSPLLKRLVDSLSRELALYLVVLWFIFSSLLPTIADLVPESWSPLFTLHEVYGLNFFSGYLGYFFVGYYLMKMDRQIPKKWLLAIILVDAAVIALGTWWKTESLGYYSELFRTHRYVFTVVISCATFLLFKELLRNRQLGRFSAGAVDLLGPLVFGIYLSHPLMIDRITASRPVSSIGLLIGYYLAILASCIGLAAALSIFRPIAYVFVGGRGKVWWRRKKDVHGAGDDG